MKIVTTSAFVLSLTLLLPACDPALRNEPLNPTFGNAVRHNMSVQIVNPEAGSGPATPTDMNGKRATDAYGRYSAGAVKAPEGESPGKDGGGKK